MLAGRALVIAWYGAMGSALEDVDQEETVIRFVEAALSVPIRLRLAPDEDACHQAALPFSENLYAASAASGAGSFVKSVEDSALLGLVKQAASQKVSCPKLFLVLKRYRWTFKGKALVESNEKRLMSLVPFVGNAGCALAFSLMEVFCPELRDATVLARLAHLSAARAVGTSSDM